MVTPHQYQRSEITVLLVADHPHIVKLYNVYEDIYRVYMVMEYLPGFILHSS